MVNKAVVISEELVGISDAQLQKRLKDEFGFACGPITSTTKAIYIKRLQEFINNRKDSDGRSSPVPTTTTTTTTTTTAKATPVKTTTTPTSTPKTRRKTIAAPIIIEEIKPIETESPKPTRRTSTGRSPTRGRGRPAKQEVQPSISNFSDTETEDYATNDKPNTSINGQTALEYSRGSRLLKRSFNNRISSAAAATRTPVATITKEQDKPSLLTRNDSFSSDDSAKRSGGVGYTTRTASSPISTRAFRLFNRSSSLSNYSDSENEETNNLNDNKQDPSSFTENITKRLLRHRPKPASTNSTSKLATNNKDTYLTSKYLKNQPIVTQVNPPTDTTPLSPDSYTSQSNWISYSILIAGILFFAFIFSFYFYSRYFSATVSSVEVGEMNALEKEFDFNIHDLKMPGCLTNESNGICSAKQVRPVIWIIREMKRIVDKALVHHYCTSNEMKGNPYEHSVKSLRSQIEMSIGKEVVEMERQGRQEKTKAVNPGDLFLSIFASALDMLEHNPQKWHMRPIGENGKFEKIIVDPAYPKALHTTCQVKLFVIKTFWYFVSLVTLSVLACLIYFYVNYMKSQALKEKELLFELVEKSIELLQSPDEPQSLPILHIRDMLLNPQQRKQPFYQKIWDQVVQFIENNESRIKSSLENIDGEDYRTWKWISTATSQPDSTGVKPSTQMDYNPFSDDNTSNTTLQSQQPVSTEKASRTINTSTPIKNNSNNNTTSIISSSQIKDFVALTRFLKVRNIVDQEIMETNNDWKTVIRNEIINRCCKQSRDGKTHGLLHVHVDDRNVEDGLVYIKCDSIENASNAFKALHGTTFSDKDDKKVINVKFLKEERYYNRFPDAKNCNKAIRIESI